MYKKIQLMALLFIGLPLFSQTITLEFPYFAGKTYEFKIVQGDKHLVIKTDTIPKGGKVQLQIPEKYKGYKGMTMWYLTNSAEGGGLEMVINNEDFSVSCFDAIPTNESIVYKNSNENIFINANYQEQEVLFAKHDAMLYATKAYIKTDVLYPVFSKEYERIVNEYSQFAKKLKSNPLYAARFREITNLTKGLGTIITQDEQLKAQNVNDIMVNQLDYQVLYTSNHWGGIINSWVQLQIMVFKSDEKIIADAKTILKRIPSDEIYTEYVISLTKELTKAGKDNIIEALTADIKNSNKLLNYDGVLNIYQKDLTGKAPNLQVSDLKNFNVSKTINLSKQKSKYTLVVFYQSGCGPCQQMMQGLQGIYKNLLAQDIKVISIAADTDEQLFKSSAEQYPWPDKYWDAEGFKGVNFKNYAVIGTPTIYLINNKGNIVQKMSGMQELVDWTKIKSN